VVEAEWRRKGLGKAIVDAFIKKGVDWAEDVQFVLAWPAQVKTGETDSEQKEMSRQDRKAAISANQHRAITFWRSLGYRRIGASSWFGLVLESNHKAHQLTSTDDYDPPEEEHGSTRKELDEAVAAEDGRLPDEDAWVYAQRMEDAGWAIPYATGGLTVETFLGLVQARELVGL